MAKIDDYRSKFVGDGEGQITEKQFNQIKDMDAPPYPMVPWIVKLYKWLLDRVGKPNWPKDDKDAMKVLGTVITEFKEYRHLLVQKDFNYYDYPTLLAEIADVRVRKLQKEVDKIEGAKLMAEVGSRKMYLILTMEAAQKYGAGTKWCIAATRSGNMWNSYAGDKKNLFFFILDSQPKKENLEKVAVQVHDITISKDRNSVNYTLQYWNTIDNPFSNYDLNPEFRNVISEVLRDEKTLEDYAKMKKEKEKLAMKVRDQAIEAERIQKTFADPAMYILNDMDLPKTWVDKLIGRLDVRFKKEEFTSLRNLRHAAEVHLCNANQITSLGNLESVCDILDIRGAKNITDYSKLKALHGINAKGEDQEAEVYYNELTNIGLLRRIKEIIDQSGKGKLIYSPSNRLAPAPDPLKES